MTLARMVVMVDGRHKKAIASRAREMDISMGELVRRAVDAYDPALEDTAEMLRRSAAEAKAALDQANAALDETLAYFRAKHEAEAGRAHETGRTA